MNYFYKEEFTKIIKNNKKGKLQSQEHKTWADLINAIDNMNQNLEIALNNYKKHQKQSFISSQSEYIQKAA